MRLPDDESRTLEAFQPGPNGYRRRRASIHEPALTILVWVHVGSGIVALAMGTLAAMARKGGRLHAQAGSWFFGSMLMLGITASMLEPFRSPPGSPIGGIMVCYFVTTSWMAARRRDGRTGRVEKIACATALGMAALMIWGGLNGATTPAGAGPVLALGAICLLAGLLDLNAIVRQTLTSRQRIGRHLWRMCFAFFVATGSFFLGQQDVLPMVVRGSPALFVLAFAPFAVMAYWLVRVRFLAGLQRLTERLGPAAPFVARKAAP